MTVIFKVEIGDEQRRRIRAGVDRGGMATRDEVREKIAELFQSYLCGLPQPKLRGKGKAGVTIGPDLSDGTPVAEAGRVAKRSLFEQAQAAPDDAVCRHCGRTKERHGKMAYTCMPVIGQPKGRMFESA